MYGLLCSVSSRSLCICTYVDQEQNFSLSVCLSFFFSVLLYLHTLHDRSGDLRLILHISMYTYIRMLYMLPILKSLTVTIMHFSDKSISGWHDSELEIQFSFSIVTSYWKSRETCIAISLSPTHTNTHTHTISLSLIYHICFKVSFVYHTVFLFQLNFPLTLPTPPPQKKRDKTSIDAQHDDQK